MSYWMVGHTIENEIILIGIWPEKEFKEEIIWGAIQHFCDVHHESLVEDYIMLDCNDWKDEYIEWLKGLEAEDICGLVLNLETSLIAVKQQIKKMARSIPNEDIKDNMVKLINNIPNAKMTIIF